MYTTLGRELTEVELSRSGYCQYCGVAGARPEVFRPHSEIVPDVGGTVTFRTRVWYVCSDAHFESSLVQEVRAEISEQFEAQVLALRAQDGSEEREPSSSGQTPRAAHPEAAIKWKVTDRYCWQCGTHGAVFTSASRCSKCGELQRLYSRNDNRRAP